MDTRFLSSYLSLVVLRSVKGTVDLRVDPNHRKFILTNINRLATISSKFSRSNTNSTLDREHWPRCKLVSRVP